MSSDLVTPDESAPEAPAAAPPIASPRPARKFPSLALPRTATKALGASAGLFIATAYFFLVNAYTHFKGVVEFDPDEGNNVIKALLIERGHRFLDDIWSDQPPLFAYILKYVFNATSWSTDNARLTVLFFAAALIWILYDLLRREYGHPAALVGVAFLVLSKLFVPLSVSVMIGLPAITLAALGIWALTRWKDTHVRLYLALSGTALACSFATKMFVAFIFPACGLLLLAWSWAHHGGRSAWRKISIDAACWGGAFVVVAAITLAPVLTAHDPLVVYRAHDIARSNASIGGLTGAVMVQQFMESDSALFALAFLGIFGATVDRRPGTIMMALWLVLGVAVLYRHQPVWTHHRLLLTIPAAYMAAVAVHKALQALNRTERKSWRDLRPPTALAAPLFIALLAYAMPDRIKHIKRPPGWSLDSNDRELIDRLEPYRTKARYMLTSRQMYAFRLGLEVPPNLAVTSLKRFRTGLLNSQIIIGTLEQYDPGIVVLTTRWSKPVRTKVKRALEANYVRIYDDRKNHRLEAFVRRDLASTDDIREAEGVY